MTALFSIGSVEVTVESVLAMSALGLTIYQAWLSRQHNRLSVKPHLVWDTQRNWTDAGLTLHLHIKNNGIGPAIIKDIQFFVDKRRFGLRQIDPVEQVADQLLKGTRNYQVQAQSLPGIGSSMPSQATIEIARIFLPGMKKQNEQAFIELLSRGDIKVKYECLYGRSFTMETTEK